MFKKLFKKKPSARIKIGSTFLGDKISATAEGYLIFKEWDAEDHQNYYWEEWELRGFNDYDSWIEYDHYTRKISLYEPIKFKEFIDPKLLKKNQAITITTTRGESIKANVVEVGIGKVARREGTLTYHVFEGDEVAYAECAGPTGRYCIEKYNDKEFDIYKMQILTRKQQKQMLGRTVSPGIWGNLKTMSIGTMIYLLIFGGGFVWSMYDSVVPRYQSYCTPRNITQPVNPPSSFSSGTNNSNTSTSTSTTNSSVLPTDEVTSQDDNQTCYRRRVYSSGGSGTGK